MKSGSGHRLHAIAGAFVTTFVLQMAEAFADETIDFDQISTVTFSEIDGTLTVLPDVTINVTDGADINGIEASGDSETVLNYGTIAAKQFGIYVSGDDFEIVNDGAISVTAVTDGESGVFADRSVAIGDVGNAGISNLGSISVVRELDPSDAELYGIRVFSEALLGNVGDLQLANAGEVSVTGGAYGYGIFVEREAEVDAGDVEISNTGVVDVTGESGFGDASGVHVENSSTSGNTGTITLSNSGTVAATSDDEVSGMYAYNYAAAGSTGAIELTNSGSVTATGGGKTYGLRANNNAVVGDTGGISITNSGTVTSVTTSTLSGASGISALSNASSGTAGSIFINNTGDIDVRSLYATVDGSVFGIYTFAIFQGGDTSITNSGTISVQAGDTTAYGIRARNYSNAGSSGSINVANTGDVTVSSGALGRSYGIYARNNGSIATGDTLVTNAGTVIADTAIYMEGDELFLHLLAGSVLDGDVEFNGSEATLSVGTGFNLALNYTGTLDTVISANPYVHDEANGVVYAVDPTGFATAGMFLQTITTSALDAVAAGAIGNQPDTDEQASIATFGTNETGLENNKPRVWATAFGGYQRQSGDDTVTAVSQSYGGLVAGVDVRPRNMHFGAFLGGSYNGFSTESDAQKIDIASVFAGVYSSVELGAFGLSATVMGGYAQHESERLIANNTVSGGLETAEADYAAYFLTPALTISRNITSRTRASVRANYAGLFLEGYDESGSSSNLMVDSRTVQLAALRAEVNQVIVEQQTENGTFSVEGWVGMDSYLNFGSDNVKATLADLPIAFDVTSSDTTSVGFTGLRIVHRPSDGGWKLGSSFEGRFGTNEYTEFRTRVEAAIRF